MDVSDLTSRMIAAGSALPGDIWSQMKSFAIPELKKIAIQVEAIAENLGDFTPAGARALLDLQVRAAVGVIVAMTSLTLLAVQDAINAILAAVRDFVNGAIGIPLL
jgi:hypothetical protein